MHAVHVASSSMRMLSSKLLSSRNFVGDHVVYDVVLRLPDEQRPYWRLLGTPIMVRPWPRSWAPDCRQRNLHML